MPGHFELLEGNSGKYRFNLKAGNGQTILTSQSYGSKSAAAQGIESVKKNAAIDERFDRRTAKDGSPYFVLLASNKEIIGQGEMYSSPRAMENGIASVKRTGPQASVLDKTD
jgi:uncharacterized protein